MSRTKYSQYDKERFLKLLNAYERALKTGSKNEIIYYSVAIHAAKGNVPRWMRGMVGRTFKNARRETPLED